jgi:hypothetical protein
MTLQSCGPAIFGEANSTLLPHKFAVPALLDVVGGVLEKIMYAVVSWLVR